MFRFLGILLKMFFQIKCLMASKGVPQIKQIGLFLPFSLNENKLFFCAEFKILLYGLHLQKNFFPQVH